MAYPSQAETYGVSRIPVYGVSQYMAYPSIWVSQYMGIPVYGVSQYMAYPSTWRIPVYGVSQSGGNRPLRPSEWAAVAAGAVVGSWVAAEGRGWVEGRSGVGVHAAGKRERER